MKIKFNQATFILSAARLSQLPPDEGVEVAFAGRSNAGKSSALNVITGINGLARTSKTPGRTQLINLFKMDDHRRLVDLPGYGYAKVSKEIKQKWERVLSEYLHCRQCLRGLILIMDIRHPLKALDENMINWCCKAKLPIHILLTKSDKLKQSAARITLNQVEKTLSDKKGVISLQLFSATKKQGVGAARVLIEKWCQTK